MFIVCLTPSRYLPGFRKAPHDTHVKPAVIHQVIFNSFLEFPLACVLFSYCQGNGSLCPEKLETPHIFASDRFLDEERAKS